MHFSALREERRGKMRIKFGVVTDVHHADKGQDLTNYMMAFVKDMNQNFHPDFVIELGDFYGGVSATKEDLRHIDRIFKGCEAPTYYVFGNVDSWSDGGKEGFKETVGIDYTWYSFDMRGFHFILLDGAWTEEGKSISPDNHGEAQVPPVYLRLADGDRFTTPDDPIGHVGHIPNQDIQRLKEDLAATQKRSIVFCHYPINLGPHWARLDNEAEIVEIFEKSEKVIAVFAGHHPLCRYKEDNGIHYFTLQGMGQNCERFGSYAKVVITENKIIINGEAEQTSYDISL
ncbi:MAG: alkaline phosphatase [Candidatus Bathyarchaeota archaeon B63]|nr:MAG: alkaline phosphatase [Candidatus Bathyarchaeota archaeon B63]